ncbi:hypothetical protein AB0M20_21410 [Actinoplanes sp. NPDC051633]|uniref:hypothetical protein n=1 Tax=Actinoplanes sp. NPDC051633 TaxID=3155670 RepID=UPI003438F343
MTVDATDESTGGEPWAPLVDLSDVALDRPVRDDGGMIDLALRRVLDSLHDRDGVISSFGSFVSDT